MRGVEEARGGGEELGQPLGLVSSRESRVLESSESVAVLQSKRQRSSGMMDQPKLSKLFYLRLEFLKIKYALASFVQIHNPRKLYFEEKILF